MAIKVLRGGRTAREWSGYGKNVHVSHSKGDQWNESSADIGFFIDSKGGGETQILVKIQTQSFEALAKAMLKADPEAAIKAFGATLQSWGT